MRYFKLRERGSDLKTETVSGITTFFTMAYIVFVNPAILSQGGQTGIAFESVFIATCLGAGLMSIAMGLISNMPYALAAGLGVNSVVVFTLISSLGFSFAQAMGILIIAGILVAAAALTKLRTMIMDAIPMGLKYAMMAGLGLFLAFMGLRQGGFVAQDTAAGIIQLGDFTAKHTQLAAFGLLLTIILAAFKIKGAILLGILGTAAAGLLFQVIELPRRIAAVPTGESFQAFFTADPIGAVWGRGAVNLAAIIMIFTLFMTNFFDTLGTAIGVGTRAGHLDQKGRIPQLRRVLLVDAAATALGGFFGAGTVNVQMESASGVSEGGRTGLMPTVTGVLFLLSIFFAPLLSVIGGGIEFEGVYMYPVTAPALIMAGFLLMRSITKIGFKDFEIGLPAFLTMVLMPLTHNIAYGIGFGFISYTLIKLLRGKYRQLHPLMVIVSVLFIGVFIGERIARAAAG